MLAIVHRPVERLQYRSLTIDNTHMVHLHHLIDIIVVIVVWQVDNLLSILVTQYMCRNRLTAIKILFQRNLGIHLHVLHLDYMSNEVRNIIGLREDKNNLQVALIGKCREENLQLVTCLRIKTNERIVHYKHPRVGKQSRGKLELTELSAGQ